jgi:hypothetical protein
VSARLSSSNPSHAALLLHCIVSWWRFAQEPGIADSLRSGRQFSLYLPATSLSGIKAQVVAERVEAVLLGATANKSGDQALLEHHAVVNLRVQLYQFQGRRSTYLQYSRTTVLSPLRIVASQQNLRHDMIER